MRDLPHLLERTPPLRDHETVPPEREPGLDGSLRIYTLTPDRIRHLTEEDLEREAPRCGGRAAIPLPRRLRGPAAFCHRP